MLTKFRVRNFRNFKDWFEVDLNTDRSYEFNNHAIEDNVVKHGAIYGKNGGGKSNLGLAILDITCHLTDVYISSLLKNNYLNAFSDLELAEFEYHFVFDNQEVVYKYGKFSIESAIYETLTIGGVEVVSIDRRDSEIATYNLVGSENLKNDFTGRTISPVKFLKSNALLDHNYMNEIFDKFLSFVSGMVFFRTLTKSQESYGQPVSSSRVSQVIIEQDMLNDFEVFLNNAGVQCKLKQSGSQGEEIIEFDFGDKSIEFSQVASTGTLSLGNFYFWYLKLKSKDITFAYIDEFDAYYHFSLSRLIVQLISETNSQTIITTHNSTLMSNNILRPDCYFVLDSESLTPLHKLTDRDIRKAHNLEKMYRSGAFDE
ncbi:AAA family ATPase [Photobacterium angustum]|uniref:Chromosome segregation protein SMC n=1 Tax=Photobacterium angustum TaxID=661 RepID=A0A855SD38_PHOAN|nr:ATP-binding protein [Photobacterium angustum]KJF83157.1 chromosome segregation protein SMC [Photobacterium damselae subsp. damselae]KJG43000.1 chromosome segregation protein SMC [Photobacterium angustum]KJG47465.1 chromosome segregation protein SMC [Photobacterium angustum]KJG49292.1 chromosome segregation protein SMC [Photobacterium angustum]KJG53624.1 chromosome segregation protein SMC [Photobacterium angustum]